MNNCFYCSTPIKSPTAKKFCNASCSAKFNNALREPRSDASRAKTSNAIKTGIALGSIVRTPHYKYDGPLTKIYFKTCPCGETFYGKTDSAVYCNGCRTSIRIKNGIRTHRITYRGIMLDSAWELIIAKYLDANQIIWERPKRPIPYTIDGKSKSYYPDFFLPELKLYLDPKNPYRLQVDKRKIEQITTKIDLIVGDVNYVLTQLKLRIGTA